MIFYLEFCNKSLTLFQICDMFEQGERGFYMGLYTLSVTNGPHVSPIIGGYITQNLGWRWSLWVSAITQGGLLGLVFLTMPETLFSRETASALIERTYAQKLLFIGKVLDRPIRLRDFGTPFRMIRYTTISLPALYFASSNTYGSALFAVTGAKIAAATYKFDVAQTGLFIGIPLTVGCMIGEATTGWISDIIINQYAKRHNGYRKPEARLFLIPLCTLLGIGAATYGFGIQHKLHYIIPAICMGVSGLGCQVAATVVYTYCTDSYKPQSGEIGAVINFYKARTFFSNCESLFGSLF
jgi:MFS family permease